MLRPYVSCSWETGVSTVSTLYCDTTLLKWVSLNFRFHSIFVLTHEYKNLNISSLINIYVIKRSIKVSDKSYLIDIKCIERFLLFFFFFIIIEDKLRQKSVWLFLAKTTCNKTIQHIWTYRNTIRVHIYIQRFCF